MANNKKTSSVAWWAYGKNEAHKQIYDTVNRIHQAQQDRYDRNVRCVQLYGSADLLGMNPYSYARMNTPAMPEGRVKMNIISSMVDTVTAKVGKMRPKITYLTKGGNVASQDNAKKLDKFTLGLFYKNGVHALHQMMFRDGAIMDIGAIKHCRNDEEGKIESERVLPTELYVDPSDAMYGSPMSMYQAKFIHKDTLIEMHPKAKTFVGSSASSLGSIPHSFDTMADYVVVIEAWHLPSGKKPGRHVICVENGTLSDEPYRCRKFPFTFFRWSKPLVGFFGQSLAERLIGNQVEINKMLRIIQKSFHLGSAFKVFIEYGSKVVKEHLNNDVGSIVYYTGTRPEFYVPKTVHEEYFRHLEWLVKSSYEEAGVSQLSATSQKPAGLDSGKAMREYNDIETERFALISQDYENSFLETAWHYTYLAKEMKEDGIDIEVQSQSKKFVESIKWSDIDIDEDEYITQMFPTSMLPQSPAGRLAWVEEMMGNGLIDRDFGLTLLNFPDTEEYVSLETAAIDDIKDSIFSIVSKGKYMPPEPFSNLPLGLKMFQSAYLRAKKDGVDPKRLDMMRRWMVSAKKLDDKAKAEAAMAQQVGMQSQSPQPQEQLAAPEDAGLPQPIPAA